MERKKINIALAGCKDTTYEVIVELINFGCKPDLIITINENLGIKNKVAGYYDLSELACEYSIPVYYCNSYSLKNEQDFEQLQKYKINLLLVIGWQRLIPEWLLNDIEQGAFGMHGSPFPLPKGRGRSPMNWSLIQGKKTFITNLFRYKPGIDDGDILSSEIFDINIFDDAKTCHYKNLLCMIKILKERIPDILSGNFILTEQPTFAPSFYPKRNEEDGIIFWDLETDQIYNLIRGVTYPFPGAFTFIDTEKVIIWKSQPFDSRIFNHTIEPGTILKIFKNGDFIVKTGTDSLLVSEYDSPVDLESGMVFNSSNYTYKNPFLYPQ